VEIITNDSPQGKMRNKTISGYNCNVKRNISILMKMKMYSFIIQCCLMFPICSTVLINQSASKCDICSCSVPGQAGARANLETKTKQGHKNTGVVHLFARRAFSVVRKVLLARRQRRLIRGDDTHTQME